MTGAGYTAHVDTFARDNLPPPQDWPTFDFSLPGGGQLTYPARLNCATELLDRNVARGYGHRPALHFQGSVVTYGQLLEEANRIARVLVEDLGVVPGNRVLLRGPNNPTLIACWFAVLKAGAIAVTVMHLLRTRELRHILDKAQVSLALCDARYGQEMEEAVEQAALRPRIVYYGGGGAESLEARAAGQSSIFDNVETAQDDVALIAFTSGTTGLSKGTMHFHRDVVAGGDTYSRHILQPQKEDVFVGTAPLAFAFGINSLVMWCFPAGASSVLIEQPTPDGLLQAIQDSRATTLFTVPTMYRNLEGQVSNYDISSLRRCVSAGETLPLSTFTRWREATGLEAIDGLGSTEMLNIFISAPQGKVHPGCTGMAVPGYHAEVVNDEGIPVPLGTVGRLAVWGPTGCRYLADPERQRAFMRKGKNLTGDACIMDEDAYFRYQARSDDMIISAGYNVAGVEVENVLLEHPKVRECAVVGLPDEARGNVVTAYVVLCDKEQAAPETVTELQDFVKAQIAPYKYPRVIEFLDTLPRTDTGKVQRYVLRQQGAVVDNSKNSAYL